MQSGQAPFELANVGFEMAALALEAFNLASVGLQGGSKLVQFECILPGVGLIADMNERFDVCLELSSPYFALPEANPRFVQRVLASGDGGGAMLQFFAQLFGLLAHLSERKAARISDEKSSGSSQAAKWPPLFTSLK